jgi:hypothetical protein
MIILKCILTNYGDVVYSHLVESTDQWEAFVNMIMNIQVQKKAANSSTT